MGTYLWHMQEDDSLPIIATAIHEGHDVRTEIAQRLAISEEDRLREEDPHTGTWAQMVNTWVIVNRSRFEVDLNRPRDKAIYRLPEDAWGLHVWKEELSEDCIQRSLAIYDAFYEHMYSLLSRFERRFKRFVVYDLHSYNHRRDGPDALPASLSLNPEVNVGTSNMEYSRWSAVVDRFIADLGSIKVADHCLDVRENIKFRGGNFARWVHTTFPQSACVLSIEVKKCFMDEWTAAPDNDKIAAIFNALQATVPSILDVL